MDEYCSQKMSQAELRGTETRRVLLSVLHTAAGPLAPPAIVALCHEAGRKVNKTTIYRDLAMMEKAGIVHRVIVSDRKQYFELTERGHHHHFICTGCEVIQDVDLDENFVLAKAKKAGKRIGFSIVTHAFEFYGRCAECT
ncbi:MAG: Fur family transcriptional regulator [Undibacterium sp.]